MNIRFILLGIFQPGVATKDEGLNTKQTANELLAQRDWKLVSEEFDNLFHVNGIMEYFFTWRFAQGDQTLDYLFRADNILKLDEEQLVLYNDEPNDRGQVTRHINTYRH